MRVCPVSVSAELSRSTSENDQLPSADRIFKTFNTWRFKREQPSDSLRILQCIDAARLSRRPLQFLLYWGKGPRKHVALPDLQCLDYLKSMTAGIESAFTPGVDLVLICTDTHARLNGHSETETGVYFSEVREAAALRGFRTRFLTDLVGHFPAPDSRERRSDIPASLAPLLVTSAAKWHRGSRSPEEAAQLYFDQNMIEKRALEATFPNAIFVTFNNSKHNPLFPDKIPIFYMYALKKGVATKPWFLDAHGNSPLQDPVSFHASVPSMSDAAISL